MGDTYPEPAGLKLIASDVPLHGIGIDTPGRIYMGRVLFGYASKRAPGVVIQMSVDTQITSGQLPVPNLEGVIGRDVLQHFEMTYNGRTGNVRMKYLKPSRV